MKAPRDQAERLAPREAEQVPAPALRSLRPGLAATPPDQPRTV